MTETRWLNETEQQAWRALNVIANRGLPRLERSLRDNDMLLIEYGIFVALSEVPGGEMRLSDLADFANTSQSRLSHRLRSMVERGDVETRESETDRRATYARLTPTGLKRLKKVAPVHAEDVQQLLFDHLDDEQTAALAEALSTIAATLCDHTHFQPDDQ